MRVKTQKDNETTNTPVNNKCGEGNKCDGDSSYNRQQTCLRKFHCL